MSNERPMGGVIHTYQKYDPRQFPSPTHPAPDLVSDVFDHLLMFGDTRRLTPEQLARAVKIDPSQLAGWGPSIDALRAMLLERRRKILEKYEVGSVLQSADQQYRSQTRQVRPPKKFRDRFVRAAREEQLYELEQLWLAMRSDASALARQLMGVIQRLGEKYALEEMAARYEFSGRTPLTIAEALAVKEELDKIEQLLKQLDEARENAQLGLIDLELLAEFAQPGDLDQLSALQQQLQDYLRELATRQGIEQHQGQYRLTPQAYRIFQNKLLERIFANLQAGRSGRHQGAIAGEGAVELQRTKAYEFGDSIAHMDIPQTLINALLRGGGTRPVRIQPGDIEIHRTRNNPKAATVVVMDMSGSMRYDMQYVNVKRMALALDGLIRSQYPGDYLRFVEMYTFAKPRQIGELPGLLPKPVTITHPWVRLQADMSREEISEFQIHPHFTNIQHALQTARLQLAAQDTPNRQIVLITDGLPTAHFEGSVLYLLYPPDPRTELATMREAMRCQKEGITINLFLVPSWSQSEEDIRFAYRLAESTKGRVFFTAGGDLDRYVVWDYVAQKREILG